MTFEQVQKQNLPKKTSFGTHQNNKSVFEEF